MAKRKTHEEFVKEVSDLVGEEYEVLGKYVNAKTKLLIKHNKCSHEWDITPDDFLRGRRCPKCQHRSFRKTTEEFQKEVDIISKGNYKVVGEYINAKTKIDILDVSSNEIFTITPSSFLRYKCSGRKPTVYTTEIFREKMKKINSNIEVLGDYINSITKILCRCKIDGNEWSTRPTVLLKGSGCPKCSGVYQRNKNDFIKEVLLIHPNIKIIGEYKRVKSRLLVKCLKCGGEWNPIAQTLLMGYGCPYCSNQKILVGFNDMWTTNPDLAKLLANPEDGYKHFQGSNKKINFKCPDCGTIIKNKSIANVKNFGLSCNKCSDGVSYPNKIMYNILSQLGIDFIAEYSPKWLKPKRFDFYFEINKNKYVVEMDGAMGHGRFNSLSKVSPEESIAIDRYKDAMALQHNVKIIRIDCLEPELNYIKENIYKSNLNTILDLNNINWLECHKLSLNSYVKTACELWNTNKYTIKEIAKILKLHSATIVNYLKKGNRINWCVYDSEKERIKNLKNMTLKSIQATSKKVRCMETNQIFNSIMEASRQMNCYDSQISLCCRGKAKFCGKLKDGTKLHWEYV